MTTSSQRAELISEPARAVMLSILPRARWRGRLLGFAGDRKTPTATDSREPEPEAEERAGDLYRSRRKPQRGADHHNGCAGQSGDGVNFGAQHDGDLGQQ